MSNKMKSAFESMAGVFLNVMQAIMAAVKSCGGSDGDFYLLSTPEGEDALKQIGQIVTELGKKVKEVCFLAVDYGASLADAITAGGFDWVKSDITEANFPAHEHEQGKKSSVPFKLFHFGRLIDSGEAIAEMDRQGFRPATLRELLAYGKANPELQRQFPIIALLSVWVSRSDGRCVAGLYGVPSGRSLPLRYCGGGWGDLCRFLAVRK